MIINHLLNGIAGIWFCAALGWFFFVASVQGGSLSSAEINQIESGLGIVLSATEIQQLGDIVKPDAPLPQWRIDADARIDAHRKANLNVRVVDADGAPVAGAQVSVKMRRNAFHFGGIMNIYDFHDTRGNLQITTQRYRDVFLQLFNAAGLDNGLKPKLADESLLPGFFSWAQANGLPVRGHLLIWPGGDHLPEGDPYDVLSRVEAVEAALAGGAAQNEIDALKADLKNEVDFMVADWASRWPVYEWDVINEPINNHRVQDLLGYDQMASWFNITETNAGLEECQLLLNDYQIVTARSSALDPDHYPERRDAYMANVDQIISDGGSLNRLGFQGRIRFEHLDPQLCYNRLDEFGTKYGLEMVGTEFEVRESDPGATWFPFNCTELERAQITEEMLAVYYSHPLVTGLNAWTYMKSELYSMCSYDGSVKLNGLAWYYLHRIRYNTDEELVANPAGIAGLRGFKGSYDITVSYGGKDYPVTLTLASNQTAEVVLDDVLLGPGSSNRLIEDWQMNDTDGTPIGGLVNGAGLGAWAGDLPNVTTSNGFLRFVQGNSSYRNSSLSVANVTSGVYELSFEISAAAMEGGDNAGAAIGFGLRDEGAGLDLFLIRLLRQNSELLLQSRIGGSSVTYHNFNSDSLVAPLNIRAVVNLDNDLMDLYYTIGSNAEVMVAGIAVEDGEMDQVRMSAVLTATDFGATDYVDVGYVSLRSLNWISADALYGEWVGLYPGMGSSTNLTDNPDGDRASNLLEYALGGDPVSAFDFGDWPVYQLVEGGEGKYIEYIYMQRLDDSDRGLTYGLELTTDLSSNAWSNSGYEVMGSGEGGSGWQIITNRISTEILTEKFIRLRVEYR